jgi:hypothetical protein
MYIFRRLKNWRHADTVTMATVVKPSARHVYTNLEMFLFLFFFLFIQSNLTGIVPILGNVYLNLDACLAKRFFILFSR